MTHAGEYVLSDRSYARLPDQLAQHNFERITPELRENILAFYCDPQPPVVAKRNAAAWEKTQNELQRLRAVVPIEAPAVQLSTLSVEEMIENRRDVGCNVSFAIIRNPHAKTLNCFSTASFVFAPTPAGPISN